MIKDGQVVEAGTHEQLLARPEGVYRTLSELQFQTGEYSTSTSPLGV